MYFYRGNFNEKNYCGFIVTCYNLRSASARCGDGKINSTDLSMLRKNIISWNTDYAENPQCDIKIDGKIDILDLIRLKKLVAENS